MKKKQRTDVYRTLPGYEAPEVMDKALRQLSAQLGNSLLDLDAGADVHGVVDVRFRVNAPNADIWGGNFDKWLDPAMKKITELINTNCGGQSIKLHWNAQNNEKSWFEISGFLREKEVKKK